MSAVGDRIAAIVVAVANAREWRDRFDAGVLSALVSEEEGLEGARATLAAFQGYAPAEEAPEGWAKLLGAIVQVGNEEASKAASEEERGAWAILSGAVTGAAEDAAAVGGAAVSALSSPWTWVAVAGIVAALAFWRYAPKGR